MDTMVEAGKSSASFKLVGTDTFNSLWWRVKEIVSTDGTGLTEYFDLNDLYALVMQGRLNLWAVIEDNEIPLVVITSLEKYPKKLILNIHWVGGERLRRHLRLLRETFDQYAKFEGCTEMAVQVEPRLAKVLERYGGKTTRVVVKRTCRSWSH